MALPHVDVGRDVAIAVELVAGLAQLLAAALDEDRRAVGLLGPYRRGSRGGIA
jgi:hypothetical protein